MSRWEEEEVRKEVEKHIGRRLREREWGYLLGTNLVREIITGSGPAQIADLVDELSVFARKSKRPPSLSQEIPSDCQAWALANILAIEARQLPEVIAFRYEVLEDKLLSEEEIPSWINKQAEEEKSATEFFEIPLPPGINETNWRTALAALPDNWPVKFGKKALAYPVPGDKSPHNVLVRMDGVTGRLKRVAEILTKSFPWQEAQAVAFVLSDQIPLAPLATISAIYSLPGWGAPQIQLKANSRLDSRRVASLYSKVRREVLHLGSKGRGKPISEKAAELAIFLAENPIGTWKDRMNTWNRIHPKWSYQDRRWFARDAKAAFYRVTGREWHRS